ncbi:MAG: hypothetical protein J5630_05045 [Bacteroidaceae bacterium]|nr:hypothetical protein [Bacteroidaceae bacterium]
MNRIQRLLTLLLFVCGMATGAWASSTPGALSGLFTINASGDKVQFSQGNLQYFCSTSNPEWRFAEHQYDYIAYDNSAYSENSGKWIDLFAYGTSGYNNGQDNYQPWKICASGSWYSNNLAGNADWGYNAISNGGNTENSGWRTLTKDEWKYLFQTRTGASLKYGFGSIGGTHGVILLPDSWTLPDGLSFTAGTSAWTNSYTTEQWTLMEANGAVFLPASGSCNNQGIPYESTANQHGFYRSSTNAYYFHFGSNNLELFTGSFPQYGDAVRLVRTSEQNPTPEPTPDNLTKDEDGYYLLASADDWKAFAAIVNGGAANVNARMTADIDLGDDQTIVGNGHCSTPGYRKAFSGIFDGQGHTLTIHYVTEDAVKKMYTDAGIPLPSPGYYGFAPFGYVWNGTIRNLHTAGTITTTHEGTAGVIGWTNGTVLIENCHSSVDITCTNDARGMAGITYNNYHDNHNLTIRDCIYDGTLTAGTNKTGAAGFVVYNAESNITINNSLLVGTFANELGSSDCATFVRNGNGNVSLSNLFYKTALGTVQGTQATTEQLADGTITTALQAGREEEVWVQDPLTNQPMLKIFANKNLILGDANDSGEVEIGDITSVLTLMATPDATGYNNKAADANKSGDIEIGDITTILTIMAGGE